jgi:catechol 2,3-dioxygenase-like lactoylglutathione lyase family enzyme
MTAKLPSRLHHTAYVTKDMEKTRHFYEDILGLPLIATWCETDFLFGKDRTYCHCFFGIGDGGALAFFQFADKEDEELFVPDIPATPFVHLALNVDEETQEELEKRIKSAGLEATYVLEHGYCRSVYVVDPNGMTVEFTNDDPRAAAGDAERKARAHDELKRWLGGDHTSNNTFRHAEAAE